MQFLSQKFDHHIHIGQFRENYFQPHLVIKELASKGIKGCWFSSTTSAMSWSCQKEKIEIIKHIQDEINEALEASKKVKMKALPLYWVVPQRHREGESIEAVMEEMPYFGFKIHPRAHNWNPEDPFINQLLHKICKYAEEKNCPVVFHTGEDMDHPQQFLPYFKEYPQTSFVLAHCRPWQYVLEIIEQNSNVKGDTSFVSPEIQNKFIERGLGNRLLYGSDYPIGR